MSKRIYGPGFKHSDDKVIPAKEPKSRRWGDIAFAVFFGALALLAEPLYMRLLLGGAAVYMLLPLPKPGRYRKSRDPRDHASFGGE
jgi:hypothetical protein